MSKYVYPAIFTKEDDGLYSISFPDFDNCFTSGESIQDGIFMASDVLCLTLYELENNNSTIPNPSDPAKIKTDEKSFATLVCCDTLEYRKFFNNKARKKTLTVPAWLDDMAVKEGVNFSQTLQNALMEQLHINH